MCTSGCCCHDTARVWILLDEDEIPLIKSMEVEPLDEEEAPVIKNLKEEPEEVEEEVPVIRSLEEPEEVKEEESTEIPQVHCGCGVWVWHGCVGDVCVWTNLHLSPCPSP